MSDTLDVRMAHGLRIAIDRSLCVGFGDCVTAAPDAFKLDDEGIAMFVEPGRVTREELLAASDACPVDAITVWDGDGSMLVPS